MAMKQGSRSGPVLNAVALVVLVVILGLVALVTKPPTPPSVAEFAPQAVDLVQDAPGNQSSQFGSGGRGGEGGVGSDLPPEPPERTIDAARVKRCVGNPPRQIEDPQSPPCADYWKGDNGGATSRGVTRDEIRIVTAAHDWSSYDEVAWAEFFSRRFEFYGRKLKIQSVPGCNTSDAVKAEQEIQAFAVLGSGLAACQNGAETRTEFAQRGLVTLGYVNSYITEGEHLGPGSPLLWNYLPTLEHVQRNAGDFICSSLAGGLARFAGPGSLNRRRAFGLVLGKRQGYLVDGTPLIERLSACDAAPAAVVEISENTSSVAVSAEQRAAVAKLQDNQVTTAMCLCSPGAMTGIYRAADEAGLHPEWLMLGAFGQDEEAPWHYPYTRRDLVGARQQRARSFGLATIGKSLPLSERAWYWAYREARPDSDDSRFTGPTNAEFQNGWMHKYSQMLLLASGIQQAGPRLTPQTFESGLFRTRFPNPGAGAAPYYQGRVGFGENDHTMVDDYALIWWSDAHAPKNYAGNNQDGTFCFLHQGKRFSRGTWPKGEQPFFDPTQGCH